MWPRGCQSWVKITVENAVRTRLMMGINVLACGTGSEPAEEQKSFWTSTMTSAVSDNFERFGDEIMSAFEERIGMTSTVARRSETMWVEG